MTVFRRRWDQAWEEVIDAIALALAKLDADVGAK
jgi:hypothetical protein